MKHEPQAWAAITAQIGGWEISTLEDAQAAAAETCRIARELESPVPAHWDEESWWEAAEAALAAEIAATA
jgi:hypothetical protein